MNHVPEYIDDLIGKYLAGEASEQERLSVREWLALDEENVHYFDQVKTIFERSAEIKTNQHYNTDAAWIRLKEKLDRSAKVVSIERKQTNRYWYAAAAVILLFGITWFLMRASENQVLDERRVVAESTAVSDTLPGGTGIFMNKKSALTYSFDSRKRTHTVKLKGEAYFNVQKKNREDFIIDVGGVFIRDIGTSFNVRAYPDSDEIEVLVEEGEVVFFTEEDSGIHLRASGKGVYNRKSKTFSIEQPEPNITAYKTKFFVFSHTDLASMAEALNNVYDKQVVVPDNLAGCMITVTFRDEPIEEIVAVVAETLGLTVDEQPDRIVFSGPGCE